jgi:hypothetical protein
MNNFSNQVNFFLGGKIGGKISSLRKRKRKEEDFEILEEEERGKRKIFKFGRKSKEENFPPR